MAAGSVRRGEVYSADLAGAGGRLFKARPVVVLQTSARESGPNTQWLIDRQKVMAKSRLLIEGDVNDPCKYLLLFVFARAS